MTDGDRTDYRSIGEILTDAREERGWSVSDVSERTKIAPKQIQALEADELAALSGPVYARGFVRNLCALYDLDRGWLMTKLEAGLESPDDTPEPEIAVPEPEQSSQETAGPETPLEPTSEDPTWTIETVENARVHRLRTPAGRRWGRWLLLLAAVVVLVAVLWFVLGSGDDDPSREGLGPPPDRVETAEDFGPTPGGASTNQPDDGSQPASPAPADSGAVTESASSEPVVVATSGTEVGEDEHVPYVDSSDEGISSVLRRAADDQVPFVLRLQATGPLTARVAFDGQPRESRRMQSGEEWILQARDHFSVEFSDVSNVIIEVDGVRRAAPRGLRGEWLLYRTALSDGNR